jgi:plastocyanin
MKTKIEIKTLNKLTIVRALSAIGLLVLLLGFIDNTAILASAQDSKTTQISIVSDASRLTNTAYQPNPINIKVGETIEWTNDDSSLFAEKNRSISNNDDSDDKSNSGLIERIVDEIITNIVVNIRNNLPINEDNTSSREDSSPSSSAEFDSGIMQTGTTFSYTFKNPGTFEYYCTVHPSMVAEIVVS